MSPKAAEQQRQRRQRAAADSGDGELYGRAAMWATRLAGRNVRSRRRLERQTGWTMTESASRLAASLRVPTSLTGRAGWTDGDRVTGARVASRLGAPVACRRLGRRPVNTAVPRKRSGVRNVDSHHVVTR